ncbi:lactadherin-like [Oculina patagonica]
MFHLNLLFMVLLLCYPYLTHQHQHLIQGNRGLKRSGFQRGVSYANFAVHKFQQLQGSLLDSSCEVAQAKECALACVNNPPCVSFNIAVSLNANEKLRCELLSEDKFRSPNNLTTSQHFHHYSIKTPCSSRPCKNGATCIPNYEDDHYYCLCAPKYTGLHCTRECVAPLGMENYKITANQISASSQFDGYHAPNQGRLHYKGGGGYAASWSAGVNDLNPWFQIDLRVKANVTFVATQGRHVNLQRVTKYKLKYSDDGNSFQVYKQYGENSDKVFVGNNDADTVVKHPLIPPIEARYIRLIPTEWNNYISMRMELYGCFECLAPLGMENYKITPAQISASSQWDAYTAPNEGRLHVTGSGIAYGSWAAGALNLDQWLEIDLRIKTTVTYVATQGRYNYNQRVTKYKLQYSNDGSLFQVFKQQGENSEKVFVGNSDANTVVKHPLIPPIKARYIRLLPTEWNEYISMRTELYGCLEDMKALGMESGAIADSQITASSEINSYHGATRARLHTAETDVYARGAWVSLTNDLNQWLQVDLGKITSVTHVATQGRNSYSPLQMVTKYKLQFSDDGTTFLFYKRQGESTDAVFDANFDHDTIVYHHLIPPITARFLRIKPTAWQSYIAMRMELYTYRADT